MKAKQKPACEHCAIGHTFVELSGGQRVHRIKESNGQDYDWHEVPCQLQTKKGMASYKRVALAAVNQRIVEVRGKLAVLEANASRIKQADHPNNVYLALERVKSL
jgi:hypothetical protein